MCGRHKRCANVTGSDTIHEGLNVSVGRVGVVVCVNYGNRKVIRYILMMGKEVGRQWDKVLVMAGKAR
jgi:hypothetical protein